MCQPAFIYSCWSGIVSSFYSITVLQRADPQGKTYLRMSILIRGKRVIITPFRGPASTKVPPFVSILMKQWESCQDGSSSSVFLSMGFQSPTPPAGWQVGAHWVLPGAGLGSCLCSTLCDLGEVSYPLQVSAYSAEYGRVVIVGLLVVTELYTSSEPETIQK